MSVVAISQSSSTISLARWSAFVGVLFTGLSTAAAQVLQFPQDEFPLTDYRQSSIDFEEIHSGGPPRDGIPAIDEPVFVSIAEAAEWLDDREPVIALRVTGEARAYPLQILMYHEIVNDTVADIPVAVTFCPLCNASIVFERSVLTDDELQVLDFGTTGRLRNSDLVMYDRQSESWWQQFNGHGIVGKYTDVVLSQLPSQIVSFAEVRQHLPDARILSTDTGFSRPYGNNPYRGYDDIDSNPFLYRGELDTRLPPMERVLSIAGKQQTQLIPLTPLANRPVVNLLIDDMPITVFAASTAASALDAERIALSRAIPAAAAYLGTLNDQLLTFSLHEGVIVDDQSGSQWNAFGQAIAGKHKGQQLQQLDKGVHFVFAWLAFDPQAVIIDVK